MKKLALLTTLVTSSLSFANSIDASSAYEYTEMRNVHHAGGGGGGFGAGGYGGGGYGGSRGGISGRDISRDLDFKGGGANRREREDNKQKDREDRSERQDRDRRDRDDRGGGGRNRKD